MAGILDDVLREIGAGIQDVREKYEEAVWGHSVTSADSMITPPMAEEGPGFGSYTRTIIPGWGEASTGLEAGPEALDGQVLPPEPSPVAPDSGALRIEASPTIEGECRSFDAELAAICSEPAAPSTPSHEQGIDL